MKTTKEVLTTARNLIAQGWCQGYYARDAQDKKVPEYSEKAVRFCSIGAVTCQFGGIAPVGIFGHLRGALCLKAKTFQLIHWNDRPERTQADVLALYDAAIASLEKP